MRCGSLSCWPSQLLFPQVRRPMTMVRPAAKPRFQVIDGDTVKFGPQLVRLFGIDAPEKGQTRRRTMASETSGEEGLGGLYRWPARDL